MPSGPLRRYSDGNCVNILPNSSVTPLQPQSCAFYHDGGPGKFDNANVKKRRIPEKLFCSSPGSARWFYVVDSECVSDLSEACFRNLVI
jgi:hypothetical protein